MVELDIFLFSGSVQQASPTMGMKAVCPHVYVKAKMRVGSVSVILLPNTNIDVDS